MALASLLSQANAALGTPYFFSAAKLRAGCDSVRGDPVLSSHFSRGLAPQLGQRTPKACSFEAFMTTSCRNAGKQDGQL